MRNRCLSGKSVLNRNAMSNILILKKHLYTSTYISPLWEDKDKHPQLMVLPYFTSFILYHSPSCFLCFRFMNFMHSFIYWFNVVRHRGKILNKTKLKKRKKDEILPFAKIWMDLEGIMLSEISQTEEDKYCVISLICGI